MKRKLTQQELRANETREEARHRRAAVPKPFAIEYRWTLPSSNKRKAEWRVWRRYETERDRDEALKTLQKNEAGRARGLGRALFEYRVAQGAGGAASDAGGSPTS